MLYCSEKTADFLLFQMCKNIMEQLNVDMEENEVEEEVNKDQVNKDQAVQTMPLSPEIKGNTIDSCYFHVTSTLWLPSISAIIEGEFKRVSESSKGHNWKSMRMAKKYSSDQITGLRNTGNKTSEYQA